MSVSRPSTFQLDFRHQGVNKRKQAARLNKHRVPARLRLGSMAKKPAIEWTTLLLGFAIYPMWAALTLFHSQIPDLLLVLLGGWVIAWHSSFQHEVIHGHPTRWRNINDAMALPPLSLWLPFEIYRSSHLEHHKDERLTDPLEDPESKYFSAEQWNELSTIERAIYSGHSTLLGRLLMGPAVTIFRFFKSEVQAICEGDRSRVRLWLLHALTASVLMTWLVIVCEMSLAKYIACFVYPGTAVLMLRSFAEHRAAAAVSHRTAIVEGESLLSLLFLNNNLHAVHHRYPGIAWYHLPRLFKQYRSTFVQNNGGLVYAGYSEVVSRFLLQAQDQIVHPSVRTASRARANHMDLPAVSIFWKRSVLMAAAYQESATGD